MLSWLYRLFRHTHETLPQRRAASSVCVTYDEKFFTVDNGAGDLSSIAWADVGNVTVLTTDAGPFQVDLFWIVTDREGRRSITIPMDANGEHAFLKAMQARLAGFDNMAVVEAMSSTDNDTFQIWPPAEIL